MEKTFSLLPEWSPQEAVMLAWPHTSSDWHPWIDGIEADYITLTTAISREVTPFILCRDISQQRYVSEHLDQHCLNKPRYCITDYNDTWCRDYGPLTVAHGQELKLLDFTFQGWGGKYNAVADNAVNKALKANWKPVLETIDLVLEGGSIDTDGYGTLLTTRQCLLADNRNKGMATTQIEKIFMEHLGINRVLWLQNGMLSGDDTDSHVDNLARFCNPHTIVFSACTDTEDLHYGPLHAMEAELRQFQQTDGTGYTLYPIEIPAPQLDSDGKRLPASYVNFLIVNDSIIIPVFGCPQDAAAIRILTHVFPDKTLVTVPGNMLIRQFGGPHCATMQLPVGTMV